MVEKKESWEKRKIETASISLKKTIPIGVESEINHFRALWGLGGFTQLNKEFLISRWGTNEKGFDEEILGFILNKAKIKKGEYSREFRKFLAKRILEKSKKKEQIKRWENYIKNEEYL